MRLKLSLGLLFLAFLVAFSCTTKKPTKIDEVTIFRGKVTGGITSQPVKNALVELSWFRGENCVCKPGNVIECVRVMLFTDQPTNANGEYTIELDWDALGFLFNDCSTCKMQFYLAVHPEPNFTLVAQDSICISLQNRSAVQVVDFQIP